jgi:molybdopterin synthase catalytic subunit
LYVQATFYLDDYLSNGIQSKGMIKVLLFASLREIVGQESLELSYADLHTVHDVWSALQKKYPLACDFQKSLLFAVNQEFASPETRVKEGDEVAIFPPVSGGETAAANTYQRDPCGDVYQIVHHAIQIDALAKQLGQPEDGAVVIFAGIVRNNTRGRKTLFLEYQGYEPMALREMRAIGSAVKQRWAINKVGFVHRLGRLEIGEASVAIVTTSAHRHVAFEACHYAIDTLKKTVPIWKKEFFEDGEVWVEGEVRELPSP